MRPLQKPTVCLNERVNIQYFILFSTGHCCFDEFIGKYLLHVYCNSIVLYMVYFFYEGLMFVQKLNISKLKCFVKR